MASVPPQGGRKHPHQELLQIDTTNILFICGGAFEGLDKIIETRLDTKAIGLWRFHHSKRKSGMWEKCLTSGAAPGFRKVRHDSGDSWDVCRWSYLWMNWTKRLWCGS